MAQAHSNSADVTPEGHLVNMVVRKSEVRTESRDGFFCGSGSWGLVWFRNHL